MKLTELIPNLIKNLIMKKVTRCSFVCVFLLSIFITLESIGQDLSVSFMVRQYHGYNVSCNGSSDGAIEAIIVNGAPPYSFVWTNGSFTSYDRYITGLPAGTYTISITDANSTNIQQEVVLVQPEPLSLTLLPVVYEGTYNTRCQGCNDGQIDSYIGGGAPPYQYQWSNTSTENKISGLSAATYSLTITDINGCTSSQSKTLSQPSPLHIVSISSPQHNGYNVSCAGINDGVIDITVTGGAPPYSVDYDGGSIGEIQGTGQITDLPAGDISINITDANSVTISTVFTLSLPQELYASYAPTVFPDGNHLSCHNCANGNINLNVSGGTPPYAYLWETGQTTATISNLQVGDYRVVVTDANGCSYNAGNMRLYAPEREDWTMAGNAGTNPVTQFMGTTDNKDFVFRTNNVERLRIKANGTIETNSLFKISSALPDSFNMAYVDSLGILRIAGPTGPPGIINCNQPVVTWFRDACEQLNTGRIYLYPLSRKVGIGTDNPLDKLHIIGTTRFSGLTNATTDYLSVGFNSGAKINSYGGELKINDAVSNNISMCKGGGIVSIGDVTPGTGYRLYVREGIRTESIKVDVATTNNWADYVFQKDYKLINLDELEKFILKYKHLPNIPTAESVVKNGVDLVQMDASLLAKIEELTLYIIEQNKRILALESLLKK